MHSANLLPQNASRRFQQKRILAFWTKFIFIATLSTATVVMWGQSAASNYHVKVEAQETMAEYPRGVQRRFAVLQGKLRQLNHYETQEAQKRSQFSPLLVIQLLHELKEEFDGELQATTVTFIETTSVKDSNKNDNGHVSLELITNGSANCSNLIKAIQDSGYFLDVRLSSALENVDANSQQLRFSVRCTF